MNYFIYIYLLLRTRLIISVTHFRKKKNLYFTDLIKVTMNLFNRLLSVIVILILIVKNYDALSMTELELHVKQYANEGKLLASDKILYLKPEKNGKLGHGGSGLLWKCNFYIYLKFNSNDHEFY